MECSQSDCSDDCSKQNTEPSDIALEIQKKREKNRLRQQNYQVAVRADPVKYSATRERRRSADRKRNKAMTDEQKQQQRKKKKLAKRSLRQNKKEKKFKPSPLKFDFGDGHFIDKFAHSERRFFYSDHATTAADSAQTTKEASVQTPIMEGGISIPESTGMHTDGDVEDSMKLAAKTAVVETTEKILE